MGLFVSLTGCTFINTLHLVVVSHHMLVCWKTVYKGHRHEHKYINNYEIQGIPQIIEPLLSKGTLTSRLSILTEFSERSMNSVISYKQVKIAFDLVLQLHRNKQIFNASRISLRNLHIHVHVLKVKTTWSVRKHAVAAILPCATPKRDLCTLPFCFQANFDSVCFI